MSAASRRILVAYLLVLGTALIYTLIKLNTLDFPDADLVAEAPTQDAAITSADCRNPVLFNVFPQFRFGSPSSQELAIYGANFDEKAQVRLNGKVRPAKFRNEDHLLRVVPEPDDFIGVGSLVVEVENSEGHLSNALTLKVDRPRLPLKVFWVSIPITREVQLILMVLCAGALGSYLHAAKSLSDFIGNRTAIASWFWWYITRPFLGMTMAFVFYAVLRGGFLTGTPADVRVVNPFGAIAVAALVGMFADKALLKLAEIFDTLFKADDRRSGKLAAPVINMLQPSTVTVGAAKPVDVTIVGDNLGAASGVRVNGQERKPKKVGEKEVTVQLQPEELEKPGTLTISVVTADGAVSAGATLHVSDLTIATDTLPIGKVSEDYTAPLSATGGSQPYRWSLADGPVWLTIESGTLKGKPARAGAARVDVKVIDKSGASATKSFDLKIQE
jgi:Putative Ig domain/IPT/TIG domain